MSAQDLKARAAIGLRLLRQLSEADDQEATDFLGSVIDREGLHLQFTDDDGKPITNFQQFAEAFNADVDSSPSGVTASAGSPRRHNPPRLTREERYRQRMAKAGH